MNIALWIAQGVLAGGFAMAGMMKTFRPKEALARNMGWVEDFSPGVVKAIGVLELLGAFGVVLPWALKIAPVLTPIAALGLMMLMDGAVVVHVRRKEPSLMAPAMVLGLLATFVAAGRFFVHLG